MIGNFENCDAFTDAEEGGFTNNAADPGNWTGGKVGLGILKGTNHGIAAADHPGVDIAGLTASQAALLRQPYWYQVNGNPLPFGVDLMAYDQAVNSGAKRSALIIEGLLGTAQDGVLGQNDIAAICATDPAALIERIGQAQISFYRGLPTFPQFGTGWTSRVTRRMAAALAMLPPQTDTPPVSVLATPTPARPTFAEAALSLVSRL
jgi:lysozyme family protein